MDDFNNNTPSGNEPRKARVISKVLPKPAMTLKERTAAVLITAAISRITATLTRTAAETQITAVQMQTAATTAIQAETTVTTAQTAHTVRARHTAEITAMSITEIQANRRKNRLTISRQSIKKAAL